MDIASLSESLDRHIWPQIQTMMTHDAYFKLMVRVRELTGELNGPLAGLIEDGYVTSQTIAIRRLCDHRKDVISLRRLLEGENDLLQKLDSCKHVCGLVNEYVAHTANPLLPRNASDWNLNVGHLTEAQKAICEVAVIFDRDRLGRKCYVALIPVPQFDLMEEFKNWVPEASIEQLWEFWHEHNQTVNAWIPVASSHVG